MLIAPPGCDYLCHYHDKYETYMRHGKQYFRTEQGESGFSVDGKAVDIVYL